MKRRTAAIPSFRAWAAAAALAGLTLPPKAAEIAPPEGVTPSGKLVEVVVVQGTTRSPTLATAARRLFDTARQTCPELHGRPARLVSGSLEDAGKGEYRAFHQADRIARYGTTHMLRAAAEDRLCSFEVVPVREVRIETTSGGQRQAVSFDPETGRGKAGRYPADRPGASEPDEDIPRGPGIAPTGRHSSMAGFRCEIVEHAAAGEERASCVVDDPALPPWMRHRVARSERRGGQGIFPEHEVALIDPAGRADEAVFDVPAGTTLGGRP